MALDTEIEKAAREAMSPEGMDDIGNEVLYRLCREYPDHQNRDAIGAKIWLIGRSYAVAIERRTIHLDELSDDFCEQRVVPTILASGIDKLLSNLRIEQSISEANIPTILQTHKYLLGIFKELTGLEKRSLASKYLHFHLPSLFFIYDSRACSCLWREFKRAKWSRPSVEGSPVDSEYADFFYRAFLVRKVIESAIGEIMSPRQFDNMLLLLENNYRRNRPARATQEIQ